MQSSQNPFSGLPTSGNPYYYMAQNHPDQTGLNSPQFQAMRAREAARSGGGGQPSALDVVRAAGAQGWEAARNPILAPEQPALPQPQLPQAMSLQSILANVPQYNALGAYGAGAWQQPSYGLPGASGGTFGGTAGQVAPSPSQVTTGITVPQSSPPMSPPQMPQLPAYLQGAGGAATQAYQQAMQPQFSQLQGDYYSQFAPLYNQAQQAQSQAGLGWAGLNQQIQQQQGLYQQAMLSQLMRALGGGY